MSADSTREPLGAMHGRFQPFHVGHMRYLLAVLARADVVYAGITNPFPPSAGTVEPSDPVRHLPANNPFSYVDRAEMIRQSVLAHDPAFVPRIRIVPFDVNGDPERLPRAIPLDAFQYLAMNDPWDAVKRDRFVVAGYRVRVLPAAVPRLSATRVRELMRADDDRWEALVPAGTSRTIRKRRLLPLVGQADDSRTGRSGCTVSSVEFWTSKHEKYAAERFVLEPNALATEVAAGLKPSRKILDLGCGQGQDSLHFARAGHDVVACDFSSAALHRFAQRAAEAGVRQEVLDIAAVPYPFADAEFDVVYSHLAVHYFDEAMTRRVFAEISRVLAPGGDFYVLLNSVRDPELGSGRQLEPRYEEREPGNRKRYFTTDELADLAAPGLRVLSARYGTGTTKNPHDEWVRLHATRPQETT